MRLPPLAPDDLNADTRRLHDDMAPVIAEKLKGFVSKRGDGALVGPFPPMLHFPQFGAPAWAFTKSLIEHATLPKPIREVAILTVGARLNSRYELYAHEHVAAGTGLSAAKIAALVAGQRPGDLTGDEAVAHDVAAALTTGMSLPGATYRAAAEAFGEAATAELVYLIGCYCLVSVLLNAFDVPVPGND